MAKLRINGDSSGYVDLEVNSTGSNLTSTATSNTFNGNVGIGTSPSSILHIKPPAFTDSIFTVDSTSTNVSQRINFSANGTIQSQIYDDTVQTKLFAITNKHIAFGTNNTERMRISTAGGMRLSNITSAIDGMIFENSARVSGMANVQGSSGTGLIAAAQTISTGTTTDIARSHWGGTVWIGYAGSGQQGVRKVDFGYAGTPTVQYSAAWVGGATLTFTTSAYNLRVNHNSGSDMNFWLILMGV